MSDSGAVVSKPSDAARDGVLVRLTRGLGRRLQLRLAGLIETLGHVGGVANLIVAGYWLAISGRFTGRTKLRRQLGPMMHNVGVRSFPIVGLVGLLTGAILVMQTGDVMMRYGQIQEAPGFVALAMVLELGPLMTAFVMTARVGASFTAVLAAMRLNEEILALETMAIHPVGYLVAPRLVSLVVMMPCLVVFAFVLGFGGGALVAHGMYDIPFGVYWAKSFTHLTYGVLTAGMLKAVVFSVLIGGVSCYFGFIAKGGPTGLGRYTMVSVVTCILVVVIADALLTGFANAFLL